MERVRNLEGGQRSASWWGTPESEDSGGRVATRVDGTVGSFGIARLRPSRAAYAKHAAEAAPPALRRAPSTAADVLAWTS